MADVTIADVARRAGVSTATVSRVLSGSRPVADEIARRVRLAAEQLSYSGNSFARALRSSRSDTIGLIVPTITNPFFAQLMASVEHSLHARGKQLFLCDARESPEDEASRMQLLLDRRVDGILVSPTDERGSVATVRHGATAVPLVQLDRRVADDVADWVGLDDDAAMRLVLEHLAERGARSVAFVGASTSDSSARLRLDGFWNNVERVGLVTRPDWVLLGDYDIQWGRDAAERLLSSPDRPDAIACADDLIAIGVVEGTRRLGLRIPEDVRVTGFDDTIFSTITTPPLTTVQQPIALIAEEALRRLDASRADGGEPRSPVNIAFVPTLIPRGST